MIHVYVKGIDSPDNLVEDVGAFFNFSSIRKEPAVFRAMFDIDGAKYVNNTEFEDRFQRIQPIEALSMGCKAVLMTYSHPDMVINCVEVGDNALSAIFRICKSGSIQITNTRHIISIRQNLGIPIQYRGFVFQDVREFSEYMMHAWPRVPCDSVMEEVYKASL